jgi:predicted sugar kinase
MPDATATATAVAAPRLRGEGGVADALMIVVMSTVMLLAAGLAFDGSRVLAARREAVDVANQAARAGAQAVAVPAVRSGGVAVDSGAAVRAADRFLADSSHEGHAAVVGDEVVVTVHLAVALPLLSSVGVSSTTVTGRGAASLVRGITERER